MTCLLVSITLFIFPCMYNTVYYVSSEAESFVHDSELSLGDVLPSQTLVPSSLSVRIWNRKLLDWSGSQQTGNYNPTSNHFNPGPFIDVASGGSTCDKAIMRFQPLGKMASH